MASQAMFFDRPGLYWLTRTVPAGWPEPAPQEIVMNRIRFHIRPALIVAGIC